MGWQGISKARKEVRMRPKRRELHELPSTEIVKSPQVTVEKHNLILFFSFLSFSIYLLAFHPALGMLLNRKRKERSENEAEKEITA